RAENYGQLLYLALEFPRYFLGELAAVGVVGLCAAFYVSSWPRARLWWLDVLSLVLIAVALIDLRLSQIMGVRLDWDVLAFGNSPKMMWRMAKPYLPGALAAVSLAAVLYVLALRAIHCWLRASHTKRAPRAT